jgi:hypothetical protein
LFFDAGYATGLLVGPDVKEQLSASLLWLEGQVEDMLPSLPKWLADLIAQKGALFTYSCLSVPVWAQNPLDAMGRTTNKWLNLLYLGVAAALDLTYELTQPYTPQRYVNEYYKYCFPFFALLMPSVVHIEQFL